MAPKSISSEEFSFPPLSSQDSSLLSGFESPPFWKHSPENYHTDFARLLLRNGNDNDQTKSFSCLETGTRWSDDAEEKMDMLWEDLNEELNMRSQSLRIEAKGGGGDKNSSEKSAVGVGCGMNLSKKTTKKKNPNMLMFMKVFKKLLVMRSSSHRSPVKTHRR